MNKFRILIVEDDQVIRDELALILHNTGYEVVKIEEFTDVISQVQKLDPHLILLDINLPNEDGFHLCTKIRAFSEVPIIFVTCRDTDMDELQSMMLGGDDFVTKPYNTSVLLMRIAVLLKRAYKDESRLKLTYQELTLNLESGVLSRKNRTVELTKSELKIVAFLFRNHGRIISRNELIDELWENELFIDDNTLSVNITRIRNKLSSIDAPDFIKTKYRQGYYLE